MTYQQVEEYINSIPKFTKKTELQNTIRLLEIMGIDRKQQNVIHVAGTNGKGSVCAYIARILEEQGSKVGLFTSPHLIALEERIQINHHQISKELFVRAFEAVQDAVKILIGEGFLHPAYFEYLFAMAMWVYRQENVDILVLETGLGGRLDSTNVFPNPLLTVITSISLDHTEYLGNTVEQIAYEKAGIIKKGVPIVYWGQDECVSRVIEKVAKEKEAVAYPVTRQNYKILKNTSKSIDFCVESGYYENSAFSLPFPASYQAANGALACKAIEILTRENPISTERLREAFSKVTWAGRMEEVLPGVIVDGAHNEAGITEFIQAVKEMPQKGKKVLLFSVVKEKEFEEMIERLCKELDFSDIILTEVWGNRKTDLEQLEQIFHQYTDACVVSVKDTKEALQKGIEQKGQEGILYCAGSLYLVGQIKTVILEEEFLKTQ